MDENLPLFPIEVKPSSARAHARRTDPPTSHSAAQSVDVNRSQAMVLAAARRLRRFTDPELYAEVLRAGDRISESGCRTRRNELDTKRMIRFTGQTVVGALGRPYQVWEVVG